MVREKHQYAAMTHRESMQLATDFRFGVTPGAKQRKEPERSSSVSALRQHRRCQSRRHVLNRDTTNLLGPSTLWSWVPGVPVKVPVP